MVTFVSFRNAWKGLRVVVSRERNARFHILIGALTLGVSLTLRISLPEMALVLAMITLVFFAEVVNTAVERTLDLIVTENNQVVKLVKDMMAGAVLVTAVGAVLVGLCVFGPVIASLVT
ncbi:diacylglycerol kinase family protein [bacterium]|nr:diacylglycerol kinase family protein [bacterium]